MFANSGVGPAGLEQQEVCNVTASATSLRYSAADATWSVLGTNSTALARFDGERVSVAVTWEVSHRLPAPNESIFLP